MNWNARNAMVWAWIAIVCSLASVAINIAVLVIR